MTTPEALTRRQSVVGVILAVAMVPPAAMYFGVASSMTLGTLLVSMVILLRPFPWRPRTDGLARIHQRQIRRWTAGLLLAVALHFVVVATFVPTDKVRAFASLLPLALLLLAGGRLANMLMHVPDRAFDEGMRRVFLVLCVSAALGLVQIAPLNLLDWRRPVFPFPEPSNFALAFIPALMYVCVAAKGAARIALLIIGLACSLFVQSLTMIVGCALVALACMPRTALLLVGVPLLLGVAQLDLTYYVSRVDLSGEEMNLSNLAYLQGWQMVDEALERSKGLGIGFQQLGIQGTDVPAAELIRTLRQGEDSNLTDGTFVFAKFGADFGLIGVALASVFVLLALNSLRVLRQVATGRMQVPPVIVLARCSVLTFLIELFVRGAGYFTAATLMLCASFWLLRASRRCIEPKLRSKGRHVGHSVLGGGMQPETR